MTENKLWIGLFEMAGGYGRTEVIVSFNRAEVMKKLWNNGKVIDYKNRVWDLEYFINENGQYAEETVTTVQEIPMNEIVPVLPL